MNLFYFYQVKIEEKGIIKKIEAQNEILKKYTTKFYKTNSLENNLKKEYLYYFDKTLLGKETYKHKYSFFKRRLIEKRKIYREIIVNSCIKNITHIYIRYYRSDYLFLNFIKKLNEKGIKIILEIPTFPYDNEVKKNNISLLIDKYYRKKLYKYVDRIVTYSLDKHIWGIPCINISNGIDLKKIKKINKKQQKEIIFTSVSNCSFWHGIDRVLKSLEKYGEQINKKDIIFNIVGEGNELENFKKIVMNSDYLSKIVKFQGFKLGEDLDKIYDKTDIGIGSLARHRSGLYTMRALKNREYCAKGLPMIFSEDDPDLREVPFVYHATADEQLINIEELLEWYEQLKLEPKEIRKYSEKFSWDIQMKKVLDEVQKI